MPTAALTAVLTAEDAHLDAVAIALKYAFGHSSFRGEQQVWPCVLTCMHWLYLSDFLTKIFLFKGVEAWHAFSGSTTVVV